MKKKLGILAWVVTAIGSGLFTILNPETVESLMKHLSDSSQSQFTKNLFIFSLAAVIHSGRMKKEIRANFEMLVSSIDNVSKALREDLKKQGEKIDGLENRVEDLEATNKQKISK